MPDIAAPVEKWPARSTRRTLFACAIAYLSCISAWTSPCAADEVAPPLPAPNANVAPSRPDPERFAGGHIDWRRGSGLIALTFDDGPSERTTPVILEELRRRSLRATFFACGYRVTGKSARARAEAELLAEEVRRGHDIGNHTLSHPDLRSLSAAAQEHEIVGNEKAIEKITGARPYLFRPPFGAMSKVAGRLMAQRRYTVVQWNLSSEDPYLHKADKVVAQVIKELQRDGGGVLLMHDTHPWTVEALPKILDWIEADSAKRVGEGKPPWKIVTLDEFFRAGARPAKKK